LEDRQPADWDEGARPWLNNVLALTRLRRPSWTDADFQQLIRTLQHAGYGWLRPDGIKRKLQDMAANGTGPPPLITEEPES
jgi:hypothetical protein